MLSICALLAVHNGAKTLAAVLEHFETNRIAVFVIDHGSTDETQHILSQFGGKPVVAVTIKPFNGVYSWRELLETKEAIARTVTHDWIIHVDSDEILASPKPDESLRDMIERLDAAGYDIIDCDEFVFVPQDDSYEPVQFQTEMRHYYYFGFPGRTLHRAQRRAGAILSWSKTGGHRVDADHRSIAPEKIQLRHYIGLSFDHLRAQYLGRVFQRDELEVGWHSNRVPTSEHFIVRPDPARLFHRDTDGWRTDRPEPTHLIFAQAKPYVAPQRIAPSRTLEPAPFIVGVGRSGTTLLRLMIDAHPDIAITPETHWLQPTLRVLADDPSDIIRIRATIKSDPSWNDLGLDDDELDEVIAAHDPAKPGETLRCIYRRYASRHGAVRFGDKTPLHNIAMHRIARDLPEARFVHIIRDGRDVAVSHRDLWFGPGRDTRLAAIQWVWRIREARQQAQFLPHYMEVRFEELVAEPERVLREIGSFIDLPFDPRQLEAHLRAEVRLSELGDIVRDGTSIPAGRRRSIFALAAAPPDVSRVGRWRSVMDDDELETFERIAGDMLSDLGYRRGRS